MLLINIDEEQEEYANWIEKYPAQIVVLSMQVSWSNKVEENIKQAGAQALQFVDNRTKTILELLADRVLTDL